MQVVYEKIRNQDEWFKSVNNNRALREWEVIITRIVRNNESKEIKFPGYCTVCDRDVEFELNDRYSADVLNFRESLMCPSCHLNNRQRAMVSLLKGNVTPCSYIYIYEQVTSTYKFLKSNFVNLIGSEFFGYDYESGMIMENGIRHENAEKLSFDNQSFDCIVSQDVYEHVSDIDAVLREAYRVLKHEGKLYISVPFHSKEQCTVRRAMISDGDIINLKEPQYHGNPIDPSNGSLVFYDYGWDFLSMLKNAGFDDAYIIKTYSPITGHVASAGIFFIVAEKH